VKKCEYCGNENDDAAQFCAGCATSFQQVEEKLSTAWRSRGEELKGWPAFTILMAYIGCQTFGSGIAAAIFFLCSPIHGLDPRDPRDLKHLIELLTPPAVIGGFIGGGLGMLALAYTLVPKGLKDTSPTGAAWVRGSRQDIAKGLAIGLALGFVSLALLALLAWRGAGPISPGPISRMLRSPGPGLMIWTICALFLAPPFEELLFRGVFYGGVRRSLGPTPAAAITSVTFVALHVTEIIHFLPAALALAALAVCTLWMRLTSAAIGPAIAVHFGYNAIFILAAHRGFF